MKRIALLIGLACFLPGCQPPGFEVTACQQDGSVAFILSDIGGFFSSETPRPDYITVYWFPENPGPENPATKVWEASFLPGDELTYENRPERSVLRYGQELPNWDIIQAPLPLERGKQYEIEILSEIHTGWTSFTNDSALPGCETI